MPKALPTKSTATGEPSWKWRRILIYGILVWACYQLFIMIDGEDTRLNESIAWGWQLIIMILVTGYTGFATAQDIAAIYTTRTARPYSDPPQEPTPPPPADNQTVIVQQPPTVVVTEKPKPEPDPPDGGD